MMYLAQSNAEGDEGMSDQNTGAQASPEGGGEPIPVMQRILDNPFLLVFLGVTIPSVFYILWGVMEVLAIPNAP